MKRLRYKKYMRTDKFDLKQRIDLAYLKIKRELHLEQSVELYQDIAYMYIDLINRDLVYHGHPHIVQYIKNVIQKNISKASIDSLLIPLDEVEDRLYGDLHIDDIVAIRIIKNDIFPKVLTPRQVTIMIERLFNEKTFNEIGRELGISDTNACQTYQRALKKLRHSKYSKGILELLS